MLAVQEYLLNNSLEKLTEELAIKVRRHSKYPNLVGLCYSQLDSPKLHPVVKQCRGIILDASNNWKIVAYGLNRFFNYKEEGADEIDWSTALTMTKLDGSLIQMYYYDNQWLVATKGSPDASGTVHDYGFTFSELAWKVFKEQSYSTSDLFKRYTYCFELCTPYNKEVVSHINNSLTLLGVRDNETLKEKSYQEIRSYYRFNFCVVKSHNLNSWSQVKDSLEKLNGHENEGYVVVDANFNRVKLKHADYVAHSKIKHSLTKRRLLEIIRQNEGEEFLQYFPEYTPLYYDIKSSYDNLVESIEQVWKHYNYITDQKEFALAVKKYKFSDILFGLKRYPNTTVKERLSLLTIYSLEGLLEC